MHGAPVASIGFTEPKEKTMDPDPSWRLRAPAISSTYLLNLHPALTRRPRIA